MLGLALTAWLVAVGATLALLLVVIAGQKLAGWLRPAARAARLPEVADAGRAPTAPQLLANRASAA